MTSQDGRKVTDGKPAVPSKEQAQRRSVTVTEEKLSASPAPTSPREATIRHLTHEEQQALEDALRKSGTVVSVLPATPQDGDEREKAVAYIREQYYASLVGGGTFISGWQSACVRLAGAIERGDHLPEPKAEKDEGSK
jgi:hypothetical protein